MKPFILQSHLILLRVVIGLLALCVALSISKLVQVTTFAELRKFQIPIIPELLACTAVLALLSLPALQFRACVAPDRPLHAICQIALGLGSAISALMLALYAAHAPLILWLSPDYIAPFIAFAVAGFVLLMMLAGIARSFVASQHDHDPYPFLNATHQIMRKLAAAIAVIFALVVLTSVLVLDRPTSQETLLRTFGMIAIAALLLRPKMLFSALTDPDRPWHILPHLALSAAALHQIGWMTRAFLFHSGQFSTFEMIDAVYPRLETGLMVPFIIFAMAGIALALPPRDRPRHQPVPAAVFS